MRVYGDEPLNEWIYEAEDRLRYRYPAGEDATKCLLHEDLGSKDLHPARKVSKLKEPSYAGLFF